MTDYDRSLIESLNRNMRNARNSSITAKQISALDIVLTLGFGVVILKLVLKLMVVIAGLA